MKKIFLLLILPFFISCSSDDDESIEQIKEKYEKYLIGTWVPARGHWGGNSIYIFNNDKSGMVYSVKSVENNIYTVNNPKPIKDFNVGYIEFENGPDGMFIRKSYMLNYETELGWEGRMSIAYIDTDSLELHTSSYRYRKVSSINIVE
ncbi:MAG: hypothetical protein LBS20_10780 [Prevotella sp.]|nr:hypothetical protein [Prevotella sp.]